MKISFHGAARAVTGSKHLLHIEPNKKVLLDCGMFQGMGKDTMPLNNDWGFDPQELDYVIISHAHIDHVGLLPKLVKDGYKGKIFCTPATASLMQILLVDSARIQEADVFYINKENQRENKPLIEAMYTEEDAANVFPLLVTVPYDEQYRIDDSLELWYTDCGHVLGSAAVSLRVQENGKVETLTFSGDIGRYRDMILRSPQPFPQADYIIMESTYGDRLHELGITTVDKLLQTIVDTCIKKGGKLIMPAFSQGRTQQILYMLNRLELEHRLPDLNYYVDSPLSIKVTDTFKQYTDHFNENVQNLLLRDDDVFLFKGLKFTETVEDSMALCDSKEPCVIISASGMAEAGRVKHHIAATLDDPKNTILMTGYCEPRSLGGKLKTHPHDIRIFGKHHDVKADIMEIASLSAHGDYDDLLQWLSCQDASHVKKLFLVHGDYEVQLKFRERLQRKGFADVEIPQQHETIDLVKHRIRKERVTEPVALSGAMKDN